MLDEVVRKARAAPGADACIQALFTLETVARQMLEHGPAYAGTHYALVAKHAGDDRAAGAEFALAERYWSKADPDLPELANVRAKNRSGH